MKSRQYIVARLILLEALPELTEEQQTQLDLLYWVLDRKLNKVETKGLDQRRAVNGR